MTHEWFLWPPHMITWNAPLNCYVHCACLAARYNNKMEVNVAGTCGSACYTNNAAWLSPSPAFRWYAAFSRLPCFCWLRPAKRWSFLLRHQQRSLSVSGWMVTEKYCMYSVDILESPYWGKMSKKECDAQPRPLFQRLIHPHEFSWLKLNVTAATPQHS